MNRLNRDRNLHPEDSFIAARILEYTGLQEKLQKSKQVAEIARHTANNIEAQQTTEATKGTSYKAICRATEPAWEKAWENSHVRRRSYIGPMNIGYGEFKSA